MICPAPGNTIVTENELACTVLLLHFLLDSIKITEIIQNIVDKASTPIAICALIRGIRPVPRFLGEIRFDPFGTTT
jgi:hypothetical protein